MVEVIAEFATAIKIVFVLSKTLKGFILLQKNKSGGFIMFDGATETIKLFFSSIIASGAALIGESFKYVGVLAILMTVDTLFGWVKAKKSKKWNSAAARWGAVGKILELMFIGVLYLLDVAFDVKFLEYMGIFYFGACEIASIIENYAEINKNLPEGTLDLVGKLKFSIGTAVVKKIKKIFDNLIENEKDKEDNQDE